MSKLLYLLSIIGLVMVLLFSCSESETEQTGAEIGEQMGEAWEETRGAAEDAYEEIVTESEQQLNAIEKEISEINTDEMSDEAKQKWNDMKAEIDQQMEVAKERFQNLKNASSDEWKDASNEFNDAMQNLKNTYEEAKQEIEKTAEKATD